MPGIHKSHTEKRLKSFWDALPQNSSCTYLKEILVQDATPIRGLKDSKIAFKYPITLLCGKNGSGKTTFLQLAALAFDYTRGPYRKTFRDFFYKTKYDADNLNVQLKWIYTNGKNVDVRKGSNKWMHYDRRVKRPVIMVSIAKSVIPSNLKTQREMDRTQSADFAGLSSDYLLFLAYILERQYTAAEECSGRDLSKCQQGGSTYSCLNMGIGEKAIIHLLLALQQAPEHSVIAIDEIEVGIHPAALTKLAEKMQEIALAKKLQIFITTHSKDFIDAFPREARVLVERVGNTTNTLTTVTTTYAMSRVSERREKELLIYCEDDVAKEIISVALIGLKERVQIVSVGCDAELPKAVRIHHVSGNPMKPVIIWDGDVGQTKMRQYIENAKLTNPTSHFKFLSEIAPEKDLISFLSRNQDALRNLSEQLGTSEINAKSLLETCETLTDHHYTFKCVASKVSLTEETACREMVKSFCKYNTEYSNDIYNKIKNILDGQDTYASSDTNVWEF